MDKKKKYIIVISILVILSILEISYAFFSYYKRGTKNQQLIAGKVYLNLVEGTDTLSLTNVFPESKQKARSRTDNVITFDVSGKNTTTNKDIYYEIMLNEGDPIAGKTPFNTSDLVFDLVEVINGEERMVVDAMSFNDINARRIWVNTINRNTTTEVNVTYKLRMWLSDQVTVSDSDRYVNYTADEFRRSYASVKISVYGDFAEKTVPTYSNNYNYLARLSTESWNFWPDEIYDVCGNIIEVKFFNYQSVGLSQSEIDSIYNSAPIKFDASGDPSAQPKLATSDTTSGGNVKVWLEDAGNDQYKMYVASNGIIVFPSDSSNMFDGFEILKKIHFANIDTGQVTDMSGMFSRCYNLTSVNVSSFDTSQVTNMSVMFSSCSSLVSLDVSSFDVRKVLRWEQMFCNCRLLTDLDISNFQDNGVGESNMDEIRAELFACNIPN